MKKYLQRIVAGAMIAGLAMVGASHEASATHFRGMSISWEQGTGANANQVTFHVTSSWRTDYPWSSGTIGGVGSTVNLGSNFNITNSSNTTVASVAANATVQVIDAAQDWFIAEQTFTTTLANIGSYTATFASSARVSTVLENNNDQNYIISSTVKMDADGGERSPEVVAPGLAAFATDLPAPTTLPNNPYLVYASLNTVNSFKLGIAVPYPSADWVYGFASSAESGLATPIPGTAQPGTGNDLHLAADGTITWTPSVLGLYATQIELNNTATGARWSYDLLLNVINGPVTSYYTTYTPTLPPEPDANVPAPSALVVLGGGLMGLVSLLRRRRQFAAAA